MSVLTELKESTRDLIEGKQRLFFDLITKGKKEAAEKEIQDSALDIVSEALAIYKVTVAEAREAKTLEEIAALWKETHAIFEDLLRVWQHLFSMLNAPKNESFRYCGEVLARLERDSAEQYEFHAQGKSPRVKLTAVFEACEKGGYHAFIPEIKGVHTQGETIKDATENLVDAVGLFLLDELEDKLAGVTPKDRIEIELNFSQSETTRA
jgi:predicted RNase H-like HicB family nuclease